MLTGNEFEFIQWEWVEFTHDNITHIIIGELELSRSLLHSFYIAFIFSQLVGPGTMLSSVL